MKGIISFVVCVILWMLLKIMKVVSNMILILISMGLKLKVVFIVLVIELVCIVLNIKLNVMIRKMENSIFI